MSNNMVNPSFQGCEEWTENLKSNLHRVQNIHYVSRQSGRDIYKEEGDIERVRETEREKTKRARESERPRKEGERRTKIKNTFRTFNIQEQGEKNEIQMTELEKQFNHILYVQKVFY